MPTMKDYRTVVVGTDGSALALPTVMRAAWLARHDEANLVIVCAWSELSRRAEAKNVLGVGDARTGEVLGRQAASDAVAAAVAAANEEGATIAAALMVEGEPATALLQVAQDRGADLLVVGALKDRSIAGRLLGTVAGDVVNRAACDVLVIRPADGATELEVPESAPLA